MVECGSGERRTKDAVEVKRWNCQRSVSNSRCLEVGKRHYLCVVDELWCVIRAVVVVAAIFGFVWVFGGLQLRRWHLDFQVRKCLTQVRLCGDTVPVGLEGDCGVEACDIFLSKV